MVKINYDNLIDQVDDQVWDTVILEGIVSFCCDQYMAIMTRETEDTNVKEIQNPEFDTKCLDVQVRCIY